jgi:chromosome segregation ATPase
MTMDLGQLSQMTSWLDEEHRRDKAEMIRLQQKMENQAGELQDQARTIKELEGRLAGMQTQLLQHGQLQKALEQLKEEVAHLLDQAEQRHQQEGRETERLRAIERDNFSRALNEIRRDLQRLPRLQEEVGLRKAEQSRLGESVLNIQQNLNTLSKEVENRMRGLAFLEEGRQQDAKRIARLQQESLEALKRLEQQGSRLQMLEDTGQRHEREVGEMKELVSHLRASQRDFVEKQLLEAEHLKREMADWIEALEVWTKRTEEFAARMQEFSESFREDRQVVESIERFQQTIRREQTQVSELQRLAEERQKRQLEQWNEENEKRWRKELLRWDHQWGEQAKRNAQISEQFTAVLNDVAQNHLQIDTAWKFLESQINYQVQETRRWQGEMTRALEERPKRE